MKKKQTTTFVIWLAIVSLAFHTADAREYSVNTGGCAYEDARQSYMVLPAAVFAVVAIAAIVAVGLQNKKSAPADSTHYHSG